MEDSASPERMARDRNERSLKWSSGSNPTTRLHPQRVPDPRDAEDILQEVFVELVEANRLLMPIDHVTGWLFRVARNRIIDLLPQEEARATSRCRERDRGGRDAGAGRATAVAADGPEALYARTVLLDELELALDELPEEQREVFVAHELEGRSFRELAAESGVNVNTLLSRKRYAVLHLRERLKSTYDEIEKG